MDAEGPVLLLGATGRTGRLVLGQLLERGIEVRAIVRSAGRLPPGTRAHPGLTVIEADLLSLSPEELGDRLEGCAAVLSCLGHTIDLRGILGPPRDLVERAVRHVHCAVAALRPPCPLRFVLMSSVSVNRPGGQDSRRGRLERLILALIRALVPPAWDNQKAADFLSVGLGAADPFLRWSVLRPDTLVDGELSSYSLHEELVSGLSKPDSSTRANVAHFMCELATGAEVWKAWEGRFPVLVDAGA